VKARLAVRVSGETWRIVTILTITSDGARFKGPVPDLRRLSLPEVYREENACLS
jgi:hypothetical protein